MLIAELQAATDHQELRLLGRDCVDQRLVVSARRLELHSPGDAPAGLSERRLGHDGRGSRWARRLGRVAAEARAMCAQHRPGRKQAREPADAGAPCRRSQARRPDG